MMSSPTGKCIEPISMKHWDFDLDLNELVAHKVEAIITQAFEDTPPELAFPAFWGKESKDLEIDVLMPLGPYVEEHARYRFNLKDAIQEEMDLFRLSDGTIEEPMGMAKMSEQLRALADWIDRQLAKPKPDEE